MAKKKQPIDDPEKARKMAGGDPGWYRDFVPTTRIGTACVDCGVRIGMVKLQGRCVRCDATVRRERIERRAAVNAKE